MQTRTLHQFFAYLGLAFLCWPCLRPFEASLSFGDIFMLIAAVLNSHQFGRLKPFQVLLAFSVPTILATQVFDPDATPEAILQAAYLFGFVLPFGCVAFIGLPVHRVVTTVIAAQGFSSLVALGQSMGYVEAIGKSKIWNTLDAYRASGLNTSCSALCMNLTSLFCLLLYLKDQRLRVLGLLVLVIGIGATLAKSSVFAIPALLFYLYWEPSRWKLLSRASALTVALGLVVMVTPEVQHRIVNFVDGLNRRAEGVDHSMAERLSTIRFAAEFIPECYFFGLGYEGTSRTLTQHLGNTVHVFHIGIILIGGMVGAILHYSGMFLMLRDALSHKQWPVLMTVLSHWLSVCTMPVLMMSNQYIPVLICAYIVHALSEERVVAEERSKTPRRRSPSGATPPRIPIGSAMPTTPP